MKEQNTVRLPLTETPPGDRAERLFAQAREAAAEDMLAITAEIAALYAHARRIAEAGDVYAFGYREVCRQLACATGLAMDQIRITDSKVRKE